MSRWIRKSEPPGPWVGDQPLGQLAEPGATSATNWSAGCACVLVAALVLVEPSRSLFGLQVPQKRNNSGPKERHLTTLGWSERPLDRPPEEVDQPMAAVDISGFIAELKDHAVDHGFHVHDERQFIETYSLRQAFEVDVHPEEDGGPLDLHLTLEVDPRACSPSRTAGEIEREFADADEFPDPRMSSVSRCSSTGLPHWPIPGPAGPRHGACRCRRARSPLEIAATDSVRSPHRRPERRVDRGPGPGVAGRRLHGREQPATCSTGDATSVAICSSGPTSGSRSKISKGSETPPVGGVFDVLTDESGPPRRSITGTSRKEAHDQSGWNCPQELGYRFWITPAHPMVPGVTRGEITWNTP